MEESAEEHANLDATAVDITVNTGAQCTSSTAEFSSAVKHLGAIGQNDPFVHRRDIDGLRAVAVAAVCVFHCDSTWLPGGFIGVDIFFVISGYVVAGSLLRGSRTPQSARQFLAAFYARRMKRLTPAIVVVTLVTALVVASFFRPCEADLEDYLLTAILGLVGAANCYFAADGGAGEAGTDYFVGGRSIVLYGAETRAMRGLDYNPFMHYWSLGVEEQFYLVFPLLLLMAYPERLLGLTPAYRWNRCSRLLLFCILLSMALSAALTLSQIQLAFYLMPPRFWELASGAVLFELTAFSPRWQCGISQPLVSAGVQLVSIGLLAVGFALTEDTQTFPFPWAMVAVLGTLGLIATGATASQPWLHRCLGRMDGVGKLSYPIYLWHWPLLVFLKWDLPVSFAPVGHRVAAIAASFVLSVATRPLELWVQRWRPKNSRSTFLVMVPCLASAILLISLLRGPLEGMLYKAVAIDECALRSIELGFCPLNGSGTSQATMLLSENDLYALFTGETQRSNFSACPTFDWILRTNSTVPLSFDYGAATPYYFGFSSEYEQYAKLSLTRNACPNADSYVWVLGDSHAYSMYLALAVALEGTRTAAAIFSTPGYLKEAVHDVGDALGPVNAAMQQLDMVLRPGDAIAWAFMLSKASDWTAETADSYMTDLYALLYLAEAHGARLILVGDHPDLTPPGGHRHDKPIGIARSVALERAQFLRELSMAMARNNSNVAWFDKFDLFCNGVTDSDLCTFVIPHTYIQAYSDNNHLGVSGALYTSELLCDFLHREGFASHIPKLR